jgi:hypothetical protein
LNFPECRIVSSAIVGGVLPIAVGLAMAMKRAGEWQAVGKDGGKEKSEADYVDQAMANLRKTSRTAGSVVDTSASAGGTQNASSVAYANGATVLMVLKATLGAGGDSFQLYINPGVSAEPSSGDAAKSGYDIGNITSLQFTGNLGFSIDELKVGSAYADAVPETGTWGSVFAVLGIGCVAWLRHRDATRKTKSPSPAAPLTAIPKSVS